LLGAAAALVAADRVDGFPAGLTAAAKAVDSGEAAQVLQRWVQSSQQLHAGGAAG
jgi:anthranilate phosphoribosyltransferase